MSQMAGTARGTVAHGVLARSEVVNDATGTNADAPDGVLRTSATILVVDDEPDMLDNVRRILRRGSYACVTAVSGQEAVTVLARETPDLILTDLRMAGVDGLALLRHARRIAPGVPVVLVTAYATDETARQAARDGAVSLLAKPFTAAQLLRVVAAALGTGHGEERPMRS
jgi:DNA-binding NtrC family response regulator